MIKFTPPVRFIAAILTIWIGLRVIFWTPADLSLHLLQMPSPFLPNLLALPVFETTNSEAAGKEKPITAGIAALPARYVLPARVDLVETFAYPPQARTEICGERCTGVPLAAHIPPLNQSMLARFVRHQPLILPQNPAHAFANPVPAPRFRLSAWAQWRGGNGVNALANDGELGGSQAGMRMRYRVTRGSGAEVAVAARLSRPIEQNNGAEAAIGLALSPSPHIPVELIAERRIGLDNGGRDAWSLGMAAGLYRQPLPLGLDLDGYAQAGIVGARRRDLYGDAALVVSQPIALSERSMAAFGGGIWAGAQPGVARLDIGPEASIRLPADKGGMRLSVSWRQRVAGSAAPGSGPVLTLGTDF